MIKLVVGLGNPGEKYAKTRHNAGWLVLDKLVESYGETFNKEKFKGLTAEIFTDTGKVTVLKPLTFMNRSGESVAEAVSFYKFNPSEILVVSDDIDMITGKLRLRLKGKHGGHKGLMSIERILKTSEFPRLKIGVGRPFGKEEVAHYVLSPFSKDELEIIEMATDTAASWIKEIVETGKIETKSASF